MSQCHLSINLDLSNRIESGCREQIPVGSFYEICVFSFLEDQPELTSARHGAAVPGVEVLPVSDLPGAPGEESKEVGL